MEAILIMCVISSQYANSISRVFFYYCFGSRKMYFIFRIYHIYWIYIIGVSYVFFVIKPKFCRSANI